MSYYEKYQKYKSKYVQLKKQRGGGEKYYTTTLRTDINKLYELYFIFTGDSGETEDTDLTGLDFKFMSIMQLLINREKINNEELLGLIRKKFKKMKDDYKSQIGKNVESLPIYTDEQKNKKEVLIKLQSIFSHSEDDLDFDTEKNLG